MKVKVGLIGPGKSKKGYGIGIFIAREILNYAHSDLVALMATSPQTLKDAASNLNSRDDVLNKFKGSLYTADQADVFFSNSEIILIVISSPSKTHEEYIRRALNAGKHVLVEKPLLHSNEMPFRKKIKIAFDLIRSANNKNLFLSTNCQKAVIAGILHEKFGFSQKPSTVEISLEIGTNGKKVNSPNELFDLLIAHPLSILVKYGLIDYELIEVKNHSQEFKSDYSSLTISGVYSLKTKKTAFDIKIKQMKKDSFAEMVVKADNKPGIKITTEKKPSGEIRAKYSLLGKKGAVAYSEDHLKISIRRMIDAIYFKNKRKQPLITNIESYYIYTLQARLKELLFPKKHAAYNLSTPNYQ